MYPKNSNKNVSHPADLPSGGHTPQAIHIYITDLPSGGQLLCRRGQPPKKGGQPPSNPTSAQQVGDLKNNSLTLPWVKPLILLTFSGKGVSGPILAKPPGIVVGYGEKSP